MGFSAAYLSENLLAKAIYSNTTTTKLGLAFIIEAGVDGYISKHFLVKACWRYELLTQFPAVGIAYIF
jgi:hypothetical protein